MNTCISKIALITLLSCNIQLSIAQAYSSVEEAVEYLNELYDTNEYKDKYRIENVGDDLIILSLTRLTSKDVVESLEKDGKSLEDYPAHRVVQRNDDGSAIVVEKSAVSISSLKKFKVDIGQSEPYKDVDLLYFQNLLVLTWDNINEEWYIGTWNYLSFSFKGIADLRDRAFEAWTFIFNEVVEREDLINPQ